MTSSSETSSREIDRALATAVRAVRGGARLVRRHRQAPPASRAKKDGSAVTRLDVEVERHLRAVIRSRHPGHAIVGEECPFEPGPEPWIWYLDPLDGTRAFTAGQDNCCVAATLTRDGVPVAAAVAAPLSAELYTVIAGQPSRWNGRPVRVASSRPLRSGEFLLYYDGEEPGRAALYAAAARGELGRLTVRPGSFILNAARTARGAHDLFAMIKRTSGPLMPWDLAPARLLLAGAGGVLRDLRGRELGGMIPAREALAGAAEQAAEFTGAFGARIREPGAAFEWARSNEAVFARLVARILAAGERAIVGIGGAGGGIGKSSLARELSALLGARESTIVAMDDYLISRSDRDRRGIGAHDPAATDLARAAADLDRLRSGNPVGKPVYDHRLGRAVREETVAPSRFLIVEGVMALHPALRRCLDIALFLDAPAAVRFRRVARDMEEKGLSETYARKVHERFEEDCRRHLLPLRDAADVVLSVDGAFTLTWLP